MASHRCGWGSVLSSPAPQPAGPWPAPLLRPALSLSFPGSKPLPDPMTCGEGAPAPLSPCLRGLSTLPKTEFTHFDATLLHPANFCLTSILSPPSHKAFHDSPPHSGVPGMKVIPPAPRDSPSVYAGRGIFQACILVSFPLKPEGKTVGDAVSPVGCSQWHLPEEGVSSGTRV